MENLSYHFLKLVDKLKNNGQFNSHKNYDHESGDFSHCALVSWVDSDMAEGNRSFAQPWVNSLALGAMGSVVAL